MEARDNVMDEDDEAYAAAAERYMASGRGRSSVLGVRDALVPATLRSVWDIADESSSDEEEDEDEHDAGAEADGEDEDEDEDEEAPFKPHGAPLRRRLTPEVVVIPVPEDPAPAPLRVDIAALTAAAVGGDGAASPGVDVSSLTQGAPNRKHSGGALLANLNVDSPQPPGTPAPETETETEATRAADRKASAGSLQVPAEAGAAQAAAGTDAGRRRRSSGAGQGSADLGDAAAHGAAPARTRRKSTIPGRDQTSDIGSRAPHACMTHTWRWGAGVHSSWPGSARREQRLPHATGAAVLHPQHRTGRTRRPCGQGDRRGLGQHGTYTPDRPIPPGLGLMGATPRPRPGERHA